VRLPTPYKCDYCGKLKGEANHWWLRDLGRQFFALFKWEDQGAAADRMEHICGQACAGKALDRWMNPDLDVPKQ
jgi:hypothetical protein